MNLLAQIFTYAWRLNGKYMVMFCSLLYAVHAFSIYIYIYPSDVFLIIILTILVFPYLVGTFFQIVEAAARGSSQVPDFLGLSDIMGDFIKPLFKLAVVAFVSFSPLLAQMYWDFGGKFAHIIAWLLTFLGIGYFIMALLGVIMMGNLIWINPLVVFPSILRAGWLYWLVFGSFVITAVFNWFVLPLLRVPSVIIIFIYAYILVTNAGIMGLLFHKRQEQLRWI